MMDFAEYRCSKCGEMLVEMPKECPNCLSYEAKELIKLRCQISRLRAALERIRDIARNNDRMFRHITDGANVLYQIEDIAQSALDKVFGALPDFPEMEEGK